ncbi:MAG: hypothetical protein EA344_09575 [Alkalicoccus sp.]|nr:MAG: hypothetical protein EA344_09575 [Alkalicoccus sp.]
MLRILTWHSFLIIFCRRNALLHPVWIKKRFGGAVDAAILPTFLGILPASGVIVPGCSRNSANFQLFSSN